MIAVTKAREGHQVFEEAVRRVAEEVADTAPTGWTSAVLKGTNDMSGFAVSRSYTVPSGAATQARGRRNFAKLKNLVEHIRAQHGWETISLEIICHLTGEYEFTAFHGSVSPWRGSGGGFKAILNPDFRLPRRGQGEPYAAASPAGDPEAAVARFHEYRRRRAEILGRVEQLPAPASEALLRHVEDQIGINLPEELRALYSIANGDGNESHQRYLFDNDTWLRIEDLTAIHSSLSKPAWFGWEQEWDSVILDANPANTVQRCTANAGWIPFASGEDGNYLAIDLAPATNGRSGQIIHIGRDYGGGPRYIDSSVSSLLDRHLRMLSDGAFSIVDGNISFHETHADSGSDVKIIGSVRQPLSTAVQSIQVIEGVSPVNLAAFEGLSHLRRLRLNACYTDDLTPLRRLPLESLDIALSQGDLVPMEGHPHLSALALETFRLVDITPLCTVENLRGLDLSRSRMANISPLSELQGLRYLALSGPQWAALAEVREIPPGLAAARLAEPDATLRQALAWAGLLGIDTGDAMHTDGVV